MTAETEEPLLCAFGDGMKGLHALRFENGQTIVVCITCKILVEQRNKAKRCQYCGVPIKMDWRKSALDGFKHVPNCPRSDEEVVVIG